MSNPVEWIYEPIFKLAFGWQVIRLKPKFQKQFGHSHKSILLHRKTEISPGTFSEEYLPRNILK